jgi:hypothetical protein
MIVLDLSRLLSRAGIATPTGIDRVELAYARHALTGERPYCFAAINAAGAIGILPQTDAAQFIAGLGAIWRDGATPSRVRKSRRSPAICTERHCSAAPARCGRDCWAKIDRSTCSCRITIWIGRGPSPDSSRQPVPVSSA